MVCFYIIFSKPRSSSLTWHSLFPASYTCIQPTLCHKAVYLSCQCSANATDSHTASIGEPPLLSPLDSSVENAHVCARLPAAAWILQLCNSTHHRLSLSTGPQMPLQGGSWCSIVCGHSWLWTVATRSQGFIPLKGTTSLPNYALPLCCENCELLSSLRRGKASLFL